MNKLGDTSNGGWRQEIVPGVYGFLFDTPEGIYIPLVSGEGEGKVSAWLDSLPKDRRIVFPTVINVKLREMLIRRGFTDSTEWSKNLETEVEIMERHPQ